MLGPAPRKRLFASFDGIEALLSEPSRLILESLLRKENGWMYAVAEPRSSEAFQVPRNNHWLEHELDRIWEQHFADIPRVNNVDVYFARHWRARLGLISLAHDTKTTYIGINAYLRYREVPDYVHITTLAHELVHYSHGFGSPLPRKYRHPHRGSVVLKELETRGLGLEHHAHQQWIHENWHRVCTRPRLCSL